MVATPAEKTGGRLQETLNRRLKAGQGPRPLCNATLKTAQTAMPYSARHHSRFSGLSVILFPCLSADDLEIIDNASGTLESQLKEA